ncbi:UNVERIFIED_CONTAM: hypothetical protein K2H54_054939 [Gekko kuhli]
MCICKYESHLNKQRMSEHDSEMQVNRLENAISSTCFLNKRSKSIISVLEPHLKIIFLSQTDLVLFCCCLLRRPGNQEGQTQQEGRKPVVGRDKQTHKHYWAGRIGKPVVKIWEAGSLGTLQQRAAELEHVAEVLLTGEQLW